MADERLDRSQLAVVGLVGGLVAIIITELIASIWGLHEPAHYLAAIGGVIAGVTRRARADQARRRDSGDEPDSDRIYGPWSE